MANYYQGETIKDLFSVIDTDGNPIVGATIIVDETIAPDGSTFVLSILELGDGVYQASFTAAQYGGYYYRVYADVSPPQYFDNNIDVDQSGLEVVPVTVVGISSPYGDTLYDLIRAVARAVGDFKYVKATAPSPASQWVDSVRLSAIPAGAYKGANLWMVGPNQASPNFWQEARIKDSSEANTNLTLEPSLPDAVSVGDIGWITNLNSRGYVRDDYVDVINEVIQESFPNHVVKVEDTLLDRVNLEDPRFVVPDQFSHIYAVEAQGVDDAAPWIIPVAEQNIPGKSGWAYDYAAGRLVLGGYAAQAASGQLIRLLGYGREGLLTEPGDATGLNRSYIVQMAAEKMKLSTGDQKQLATASMFGNSGDEYLVKAVTMFEPNTIRIR